MRAARRGLIVALSTPVGFQRIRALPDAPATQVMAPVRLGESFRYHASGMRAPGAAVVKGSPQAIP